MGTQRPRAVLISALSKQYGRIFFQTQILFVWHRETITRDEIFSTAQNLGDVSVILLPKVLTTSSFVFNIGKYARICDSFIIDGLSTKMPKSSFNCVFNTIVEIK